MSGAPHWQYQQNVTMKCPFSQTKEINAISKITYDENGNKKPHYYKKMIVYPCGKCSVCMRNKANEWITRCEIENKYALSSYFVTLTYDDEHLPLTKDGYPCFSLSDVQKFFKRLRKHFPNLQHPLKYLLVSEYGDKYLRPHYHMVLFNFPRINQPIETQDELTQIWKLGQVVAQPFNSGCTRYIVEYLYKDKQFKNLYSDSHPRPFLLSSRRPAIGSAYLDDINISEMLSNADLRLPIGKFYYSLPSYYKNKLRNLYPDYYQKIVKLYSEKNETYDYNDSIRKSIDSLNNTLLSLERQKAESITKFDYQKLSKEIDKIEYSIQQLVYKLEEEEEN